MRQRGIISAVWHISVLPFSLEQPAEARGRGLADELQTRPRSRVGADQSGCS